MRQTNFAGWLVSWFGPATTLTHSHIHTHITTINLIVNSAAVTAMKMKLLHWSRQTLTNTRNNNSHNRVWALNSKISLENLCVNVRLQPNIFICKIPICIHKMAQNKKQQRHWDREREKTRSGKNIEQKEK